MQLNGILAAGFTWRNYEGQIARSLQLCISHESELELANEM